MVSLQNELRTLASEFRSKNSRLDEVGYQVEQWRKEEEWTQDPRVPPPALSGPPPEYSGTPPTSTGFSSQKGRNGPPLVKNEYPAVNSEAQDEFIPEAPRGDERSSTPTQTPQLWSTTEMQTAFRKPQYSGNPSPPPELAPRKSSSGPPPLRI